MVEFLNALNWTVTIPLTIIAICLIFRKPIGEKLGQLSWLSGEGKKYSAAFDLAKDRLQQTLPDAGATVINQNDVLEAFKKIPDLNEDGIRKNLSDAYISLLRNGVITKQQLTALVSSDAIARLRDLYIQELARVKDSPLDPIAVATWGAMLFTYGIKDEVVDEIRRRIRQSPEYRQKH